MAPTTAAPARELRKTAKRDAILAGAQKVFAKKGFDGATIADIARAAGVASGTVYLYYESKIDLFAALHARLWDVVLGAMRDADAPTDVHGGTGARVHAVFDAAHRHHELLRLVFLNPDPRSEVARRMRDADDERARSLVELLQGGIDTGTIRPTDPALLARLINGLVIIALYQCFIQGDGRRVSAYEDAVTEMIVGALSPA